MIGFRSELLNLSVKNDKIAFDYTFLCSEIYFFYFCILEKGFWKLLVLITGRPTLKL